MIREKHRELHAKNTDRIVARPTGAEQPTLRAQNSSNVGPVGGVKVIKHQTPDLHTLAVRKEKEK